MTINKKGIMHKEKQPTKKQIENVGLCNIDDINYYNFIHNLSYLKIMLLLSIIIKSDEHSINDVDIKNIDYLYLKNYLLCCDKIKQFFKYYISIPLDVKEDKYFESIIYHYKFLHNNIYYLNF
jgi:hypothetical protein